MTRRHEILPLVVEAIAEVDGSSPHALGYSLHDHVETEAVNTLAASDHEGWELTFDVPEHTVTIRDGEQILVDGEVIRELSSPDRHEKSDTRITDSTTRG